MITNYLAAEPLIVSRLKTKLEGVSILNAADLAGVTESAQFTPAVHVVYGGDIPGEPAGNGAANIATQRWLVVVACRNAKSTRTGEDARSEAGVIMLNVLKALQGHKLSDDLPERLQRGPAPQPYFNAGFVYIPTLWLLRVGITGDFL